ncbi:MAG TPA: DUF4412 domain-containing protein [Saprospiraceae bacterium]|nr:DUF4412 domain-containing protein [Saprospiraceae bacterium]
MITGFRIICLSTFLLLQVIIFPCYAQSFEGSITIKVDQKDEEKSSRLTVKGDKTLLEIEVDSSQSFKIIKDRSAETSTMLRKRNDLKYGFRVNYVPEPDIPTVNINSNVTTEITDEVKMIGKYSCTKMKFKSPHALAEAWITKDLGFSLSRYYPEFTGNSEDQHLSDLRKAVDKEGFVVSYWEKIPDTGKEINVEITVEQKDVPLETFNTGEYLVLDKDGMTRLAQNAQHDEVAKKQWAEFLQLFGNGN